jgi:hypothetical protein
MFWQSRQRIQPDRLEEGEEGYHLQGLAQAHVIAQDARGAPNKTRSFLTNYQGIRVKGF